MRQGQCNLRLPSSGDAAAQLGPQGPCHHAGLILVSFVETGFLRLAQPGLHLLGSSELLSSGLPEEDGSRLQDHAPAFYLKEINNSNKTFCVVAVISVD